MELWINKYKPKNINDIIGNQTQINNFKLWLNNIQKNKENNLNKKNCKSDNTIIISGNQGLGKTTTIKLILEEFKYIIRIINPNEIKEHRDNKSEADISDYYNFVNSIYSKIKLNKNNQTINNKIAIIFDETENITLTSERKYIMDIFKYNNKVKAFPLIFISNNQHSKLLNDLKKSCNEIIFNSPSLDELKKLVYTISNNENIKFENNEIIDDIINFSQYDIRRLINLLQELSYHKSKDNILYDSYITEFIDKSRIKNIDIGLFNSTSTLLNSYIDYDIVIKLYESEKVLLPLMIHENYLKKVFTNNKNNNFFILNNLVNILDSLSQGDNIETSIYTDQNWYLQNIHGFYTCLNTSYIINNTNPDYYISNEDIKFSSDLNKTSLKNINRKNINNLLKIINNKSNIEILMLNKICNHLAHSNKMDDLLNILNSYNKDISIKEIELCLKIDKTTEFNTLCNKDKKNINNKKNNKNQ
jgi:replication factor C subunit 1